MKLTKAVDNAIIVEFKASELLKIAAVIQLAIQVIAISAK